MFVVRRSEHNPILMPHPQHPWESQAAFNWCPVKEGNTLHVVYRAMSKPELLGEAQISWSTIGHAESIAGLHFGRRRQFIHPEEAWERYGCEDPRVTKIDGTYYIFYTALGTYPFGPEGIKVAVATTKDFRSIEEKRLVTPFNAKAMTLFPEKIDGRYWVMLSVNPDKPPTPSHIAFRSFEKIEDLWDHEQWQKWYDNLSQSTIDIRRSDKDQVEVGAPPIKTDHGWLVVYSHIQHYFDGKPVFGIEALLLDNDNPQNIIGRTQGPILVPEMLYEQNGLVANVAFPSGAIIEDDMLTIYYGAADTTCCQAQVQLEPLIDALTPEDEVRLVTRFENNPIIAPSTERGWESKYVFNPAAIECGEKIHILYRAQGEDMVSRIGYAMSQDGIHIDERLPDPIYSPRENFESRGCEDPRLIEIDEKIYMFYTAYDGVSEPRVAVSSISKADFLAREWMWSRPEVITPPGIMDKDAAIFPEKINGKYLLMHRIKDVICIDELESLEFAQERVKRCIQLFGPRPGMWDGVKVGIAAPPIKTDVGWLLLYHGVAEKTKYRVGAVLLDKDDPTTLISRTTAPILEPEAPYEREGQVPNVVFPCGAVVRDDTLYVYYGAADTVVAGAHMSISQLLTILNHNA